MNLLASVHTPHVFHRIHLMPYLDPTDPATVIYRPKRVPLKMVQYSRINSHVAMVYNHTRIGSFPRGGLSGGLRCISSRGVRPHYFSTLVTAVDGVHVLYVPMYQTST